MTITLDYLNSCDAGEFSAALHGVYEHSPWIAERAAARRPFRSLAALKVALQKVVSAATDTEQLDLIRAHPELAGIPFAPDLLKNDSDRTLLAAASAPLGLGRHRLGSAGAA